MTKIVGLVLSSLLLAAPVTVAGTSADQSAVQKTKYEPTARDIWCC